MNPISSSRTDISMVNSEDDAMAVEKSHYGVAGDEQHILSENQLNNDMDDEWVEDNDDYSPGNFYHHSMSEDMSSKWPFALAALLILSWSGFFIWANLGIIQTLPQAQIPATIATLLPQWAMPVLLILMGYFLIRRSSMAEGKRFAAIGRSLREESIALEERMQVVNNELSLAREFLASQTRELESIGRSAGEKITQDAQNLADLVAQSSEDMEKIGDVSERAQGNMEKLRNHLPVITNSAKDLTNQIGNTGHKAQQNVDLLITAFKKLNQFGQASEKQIITLTQQSEKAVRQFDMMVSESVAHMNASNEAMSAASKDGQNQLQERLTQLRANLEKLSEKSHEEFQVQTRLAELTAQNIEHIFDNLSKKAEQTQSKAQDIINNIDHLYKDTDEKLSTLDHDGGEYIARLSFAIATLTENSENLSQYLSIEAENFSGYQDNAREFLALLEQAHGYLAQTLPDTGRETFAQLDELKNIVHVMRDNMSHIANDGVATLKTIGQNVDSLKASHEELLVLQSKGGDNVSQHHEAIKKISATIDAAQNEASELLILVRDNIQSALEHNNKLVGEQATSLAHSLDRILMQSADNFSEKSVTALQQGLDKKRKELEKALEQTSIALGEQAKATSDNLKQDLQKLDELTANLERRISDAREQASIKSDEDFARNMAKLTEALNSASIDITQILSQEISDTAWAAYLRGDRGMFTRRAVRLIDNGEAREIAALYQDDPDFTHLVNRYIHDFEAMLRNIMATRDGEAMSVILLSSDIGKLYVAMAQAIERFRE